MKPATNAKRRFGKTKLMVIDTNLPNRITHSTVADLDGILKTGDLLVVNAASTLPSSFQGKVRQRRQHVEIRLAAFVGESSNDLRRWSAISFGSGDWRTPTERRGPPPALIEGDVIEIDIDLIMTVRQIDSLSPRLLQIEFTSTNLIRALYHSGRPIQYSHQEADLELWDQQTIFQGPPVSVEPPSAAFSLTWDLILKLKRRGVSIAPIVHSAGISSSGDAVLDSRLPLSEFFDVPHETLKQIEQTKSKGGRIVALGTSVTRAIESAFASGQGSGLTSLRLGATSRIRGVDVLITGMHEEGSSHAELMKAFCDSEMLKTAEKEASESGYRSHEYGDLTLLNCAVK